MYNYLIGKIVERGEDCIVLDNNGVGYEIFVSRFVSENLRNMQDEVKLFTYFQVKEDAHCLFGFLSKEEKDLFLKLISVSGVGPKGAIAILSSCPPQDLAVTIAKQDIHALSKVKGVGKKTAERILVELKDKIDILPMELLGENGQITIQSDEIDDACEVLISLGLSKQEAYKLAEKTYKEGDTAEDIIAKVLRERK